MSADSRKSRHERRTREVDSHDQTSQSSGNTAWEDSEICTMQCHQCLCDGTIEAMVIGVISCTALDSSMLGVETRVSRDLLCTKMKIAQK